MAELDDHQLLAEFARDNSEAAFATLVERHIRLVYSVALRSAGNAHAAEEITQAVFIILARKAAGLSAKIILSGWLYQTTRLTAANSLRTEIRRQHREQEAYMQSLLNEPDTAKTWTRIAPLLDDALDKLGTKDRDALALRFFENKSMAEIGAALGAGEDAAKMRVNRALEKLRKIFTKRGVTLSALAIAGAVSANSVQAAPVGLAATITATAAKGAIISATLTTLVKGTMKTMTWLKIKFTLGVSVAALLVGAAVTVAVSQTSNGGKITVQEIAKQSQAAYAALTSYSDDGFGVAETGGQKRGHTFTIRLQRPKQYRVGWDSTGELDPVKGLAWSDGHENFLLNKSPDKFKTAEPTMLRDMAQNFSFAGGQSGQVASTVPGVFFDLGAGGDSLALVAQGRTELKREADENIGDVDCYVVVSILDGTKILGNDQSLKTATVEFKSLGTVTTVFWIGKQDHLIRKTKTTLVGTNMSVTWTDAMLTAQLNQRNQPVTQENLAALRTEMEKSQALTQVSGIIFTETHEHIVVNQKFSPSDFAR